ncbi:hypothetical protein O181_044302 [Austropuccinia psidii MF-1]|uniref:Endonuclease/exonuclease/phosphatase domain-containing protein n=1 Tax=Austropuccinia psidii MF-1 TaxID=1389203 RepID=A0A9Q3DRJ5_9BASI|nr:hypothetical protein [Austropuccinia psidii MF-1]
MMDSNLQHPHWNPTKYYNTHTQAQNLIKACAKKSFHLVSPKNTPIFLGLVGKPTTIDLTWTNQKNLNLQPATQVQLKNHPTTLIAMHPRAKCIDALEKAGVRLSL